MKELSKETRILISKYKDWERSLKTKEGISTIHVDEIASKVASFYEKIRGIIDWKEGHLLKRSAIERSLRKRIFSQMNIDTQIPAEPLVLELIRSGHFPNDKIAESKIDEVQQVINKYIYIINRCPESNSSMQFLQWITSIAACEIEEVLTPSFKERALIDFMYSKLRESIVLSKDIKKEVNEEEKDIQIFINVQKALFDLDHSVISYHLIKYKYPYWTDLIDSDERLQLVAQNIHGIRKEMEDHLNHPLGGKVSQLCQKYNTLFLIIGDIISENPSTSEKIISDPSNLESLIREKYTKRLNGLNSRLKRAAFYSTLSIFLANIMSLLVIEIPISYYFGQFTAMTYAINILVPTALMAFLVLTIPPPPKGNMERVIMKTIKIVYGSKEREVYEIKKLRKKAVFGLIISLIYLISFFASIGFIVWFLSKIDFPLSSYPIFIIFLSLIAFAGTKIREKGKELHIIDTKENLLTMIVDLFALPIILFGKWLTLRWKKYNVVSVFFNALIDMPFSIFVEFLEQWRYFLKEKKERL